MEDLWNEPPEDAWIMTSNPCTAPREVTEMTLGFEQGIPVSIDGVRKDGVALVKELNAIAGKYGIGRIDMVENRVVGLKSREVYEAPGATLLVTAHKELKSIVMDRDTFNYARQIAQDYANVIYDGKWFGMLRPALDGFLAQTQKFVTGEVRMKLSAGWFRLLGVGLHILCMTKVLRRIRMGILLTELLPKVS